MGSYDPSEKPALDRIEQVLTELTRHIGNRDLSAAAPLSPDAIRISDTALESERLYTAIAWVRVRKARDRAFGAGLFSDPAWCMLLDLYINHTARPPVSLSSLSIAADVPLTTGLRWVTLLEKAGLVRRYPDPFDRRRTLVSLTEEGVEKIDDAMDRANASDRQLGIQGLRIAN